MAAHWEEFQWQSNPVKTQVPKYYVKHPPPKTPRQNQEVSSPRDSVSFGKDKQQNTLQKAHAAKIARVAGLVTTNNDESSKRWRSPRNTKQITLNGTSGTQESVTEPVIPARTRSPRTAQLQRLCQAQKLPFYATEEYIKAHYNPTLRPSTLDYSGFLPLLQGCASADPLVQRDVTDAVIALSIRGDENKNSFCQAGAVEELLILTESPDLRVRCNAAQSLANLLTHEQNRVEFFSIPNSVNRFSALSTAKVVPGTRVQPGGVLVMRAATEAIAQLANSQISENKRKFMDSGLIKPLCRLTRSEDKQTRMASARGVLWLCQSPGNKKDKWHRSQDITTIEWTTEQLAEAVRASNSTDAEVTTQVLLGFRCICTAVNSGIMLSRTEILEILSQSLRGELFRENFPLLMAATGLVSVLAEFPWPSEILESGQHTPLLANLLSLLPRTETEVKCMQVCRLLHPNVCIIHDSDFPQSAKGIMSTWNDSTLSEQSSYLASHPECGMSEVGEIFPESFRQLQCYVLVEEVLEVLDKLMVKMTLFREGLFHMGAAQHFINLHLHSKYTNLQSRCLRLLVLMAGSQKLAHFIGGNQKYMDIIHFALRQTQQHSLLKACMASIRELSKDTESVEQFVQRGLVQALGKHTRSNDPTLQINLLGSFANLAKHKVAKDQIAQLPQWPFIVRFADSFEPQVRSQASALFTAMATGNDSSICRKALSVLVHQLNYLLRASKITELVAQTIMDFVNQISKVILVQSWARAFLAKRRTQRIRHIMRSVGESGSKKSVLMHAQGMSTTMAYFCSPAGADPAPAAAAASASAAAAATAAAAAEAEKHGKRSGNVRGST